MTDSFQVVVDKATFIEVGRVFQRVYRPRGARTVTLTLSNGLLRIEFAGGGSELACDSRECLVAEMSAKAFSSIMAAYGREKSINGTIALTFRPALGEFATPIAGANANFLQAPITQPFVATETHFPKPPPAVGNM